MVLCAEGYQSSLAAATLLDLDIVGATDVIDGFDGWLAAGLPTTLPTARRFA
jgi:rhodanese-related sulfurtransferase